MTEQRKSEVMTTKEVKVQVVPMLALDENNIPVEWIHFIRMEDTDGNRIICELKFLEEYVAKVRAEITASEHLNPLPTTPLEMKKVEPEETKHINEIVPSLFKQGE